MARKGNPISVRLDLNRSSDPSRFNVNLRSYFGSIRPPTILTFGFRLGRCIILHFPKRTFIHFFLPRRPLRLKRRDKSRLGKAKGRWWAFGKVGPIGCLHSSKGTEEERKEVRGRGAGKRVESIRLSDRRSKTKEGFGRKRCKAMDTMTDHHRERRLCLNHFGSARPSSRINTNDIAFLIENDDSSRKTLLFKFFLPKKSRSDGPTSHLLKRKLPAVRPSFHYLVMQYLLNTKNKMHFDPVHVLNHFVAPGVAEPYMMGRAKEESKDKRIRSSHRFFVESSSSEKKCLAQAKKRLIHFIRLANDLRSREQKKPPSRSFLSSVLPFSFQGMGLGLYKNLFFEYAREQLLGQLRIKCWNLMGQNKVMELIEKFIDLGRCEVLIKGIEMMIEIILRKRRIPYGYNSYLNEVQKNAIFFV
ncbi:hypothetical protein LUZ60_018082 [Juncus effusus]|nr:hypothetical protein LUZ60_018082 [Juncus effusus]